METIKSEKKEFMNVMEKTHSKGIILSFPDKTKGKRDNWKSCKKDIQREIKKEIDTKDWDQIVTHNPDGEYGHIHHKKVSKYVTMVLEKEDMTDKLVYFGKYTSKKNKAELENEKRLSKKDYDKKLDIIQLYSSQSKVMDHLHHMLPYENWKPYSNWGKIE